MRPVRHNRSANRPVYDNLLQKTHDQRISTGLSHPAQRAQAHKRARGYRNVTTPLPLWAGPAKTISFDRGRCFPTAEGNTQ
jgi:hypothetical protein